MKVVRLFPLPVLALALALAAIPVLAQAPSPATTNAICPKPAEVKQVQMLVLWRAEFQGLWQGATLLIEKHPEYEGSLTGSVNRNGQRSLLAGDVDKGEFTLEESADGKRISAVWTGDVVEGSCGNEIRGSWQEEKDPPQPHRFVLRKISN